MSRAIPATRGGRDRGRLIIRPNIPEAGNLYREREYATGRAIRAQIIVEIHEVRRESRIANCISSDVNARKRASGSGQRIRPVKTRKKKRITTHESRMREPLNQETERQEKEEKLI